MSTGSCSTQPFGPLGHSGARAAIRPISTPCLRPLRAQQCITNLAPSSLAPCLPPSKARPANLTVYLLLPPCRPGTRFSTPYLCPQPEARSLLSGSPWFSAGLVVLPRCGSFLPRLLEVSTAPGLLQQLPRSAPASGVQMSTAQLSQPRDGWTAACPAPASTAVPGMAAARTPSSGGPVGVLDPAPVDGSGPLQVGQSVPSRSTPYTSSTRSPLRPQLAVPAPLRASCSFRRLSRSSNPAV
jgi:hypothetical protein